MNSSEHAEKQCARHTASCALASLTWVCAGQPALEAAGVRPSWTASYELGAVVRALERAAGAPRSVQVHCSGVDLTEARPTDSHTG